jgi:hypothetical protein
MAVIVSGAWQMPSGTKKLLLSLNFKLTFKKKVYGLKSLALLNPMKDF